MLDRPTIFALSSGRPPAAIAVVRISGPQAGAALEALSGKRLEPRKAALARLRDPESGEIIDEALALWFPGPHSETGEDIAELQLHGGRAVIAATIAALSRIEGLRPAEAGEFTRRAFENGKLDLTAVEGLADLVSAETEGQRRQAFRQMKGLLGNQAETWRQRLIQALALVEARIDFSDEADVPEDLVAPALAIARELVGEIEAALAVGRRGERLREGLVVAIAGPPNAGKSTLLNRLARREAAIVSPYAGTTRDVIEVHLDLGGVPVTLLDTAGIRDTVDPVELEGVRRARDRLASADLVLWVVDAGDRDQIGATAAEETTAPGSSRGSENVEAGGVAKRTEEGSEAASTPRRIESRAAFPPGRLLSAFRAPDNASLIAATGSPAAASGQHASLTLQDALLSMPHSAGKPAMWVVANKIDKMEQQLGRSPAAAGDKNEQLPGSIDISELQLYFNNLLKNMVNRPLTYRSELFDQTNDTPRTRDAETVKDKSETEFINNDLIFILSAISGRGVDELINRLTAFASDFLAGGESALITRARHRHALEAALSALHRAVAGPVAEHEDLLAEELRLAAQALGRLTGRVDVEDILDVIFRDFCIGK